MLSILLNTARELRTNLILEDVRGIFFIDSTGKQWHAPDNHDPYAEEFLYPV